MSYDRQPSYRNGRAPSQPSPYGPSQVQPSYRDDESYGRSQYNSARMPSTARSRSRSLNRNGPPNPGTYGRTPPVTQPQQLSSPGAISSGSSRDRLAELRAAGVSRPISRYDNDNDNPNHNNQVTGFLDSISALDKSLRTVKDDLSYISQLQRRAFDAAPEHILRDNKSQLDSMTQGTKQLLQQARRNLDTLDYEHQVMRKGTADYVMCSNQLTNLKKNYQAYVQEFHSLETQFADAQRNRMLREMRVVKADATEDDLDEYMASGGQGGVFAQEMLHSSRYGAARAALKDVQDRQVELIKVEQMVEELAQLFLDLNTLIEQQDYTINQVTEYVEEAVVQIEQGEKEVEQAIEIRKNSIKWSWYLFIFFILLILAVAVYLFVFGPFSYIIFGHGSGNNNSNNANTNANTNSKSQIH